MHAYALGERLTPLGDLPSGGDDPCHLALDDTGRCLIVCNYSSGSVTVIRLHNDGALGEQTAHVEHEGASGVVPDRQEAPHAHSATVSPDNGLVIVADLGADRLVLYRLDPERGTLSPHGAVSTAPGAGPRHMVWDGPRLYVANELDSTVTAYVYEAGSLREEQHVSTLPDGFTGSNQVSEIVRSGTRLYVANRGHDSIAVLSTGVFGGERAHVPCGGTWPRHIAVAPSGRYLLSANQETGTVTVLPLGDEIGPPVFEAKVPGAACVRFL